MNGLTKAAQDVLAERRRQRDKWGDTHDDEHTNDSLAYGAVSFLLPGQKPMPADWAYKSKVVDREPRRDQLVKGAALAVAAVEQFDRKAAKPKWKPCARCTSPDYCTNQLCGCDIAESLEAGIAPLAAGVTVDSRTCTCHPDDNPPKPCPRKFSLSECRAADGVTASDGETK